MTISNGDYVVIVKTADGEDVALGCDEVLGLTDDLVTPYLTADGFQVPLRVDGAGTAGQFCFPVITADDEIGAASINKTANSSQPVNYKSFVNSSFTKTETADKVTASLSSDYVIPIASSGSDTAILKVLFYNTVDGSGNTEVFNNPASSLDAIINDFNFSIETIAASPVSFFNASQSLHYSVYNLTSSVNVDTVAFGDLTQYSSASDLWNVYNMPIFYYYSNSTNMEGETANGSVISNVSSSASTSYGFLVTFMYKFTTGNGSATSMDMKSGSYVDFYYKNKLTDVVNPLSIITRYE